MPRKRIKRFIQVMETVDVSAHCDVCKTQIINGTEYYRVTRGHRDYGNDSIDAIEYKDICSDVCLHEEILAYGNEVSNTKFINIEKDTLELHQYIELKPNNSEV